MSVNMEQLLSDAKKLSGRLREHDSAADSLMTSAQDVLKDVEAMRQYQDDLEQLNEVAHNRPRTQLVLGIQQENRHIRQLQHENKELRAALEEHQNAVELIMSKYRQHMSYLVHTTKLDKNLINQQRAKVLQEKTDQICEMASIMQNSIQLDEDFAARDNEVKTRLVTENKGLRELLEISRKNGSNSQSGSHLAAASAAAAKKKSISRECQTDDSLLAVSSHQARDNSSSSSSHSPSATPSSPPSASIPPSTASSESSETPKKSPVRANLITNSISPCFNHSNNSNDDNDAEDEEDEEDSEGLTMNGSLSSSTNTVHQLSLLGSEGEEESSGDDEVTFNTIKRTPSGVNVVNSYANNAVVNSVNSDVVTIVKVNGNGVNHLISEPAESNGGGNGIGDGGGGRLSDDKMDSSSAGGEVIVNEVDNNSEFKENGSPLEKKSPQSAKIEDKDAAAGKAATPELTPS